MLANYMGGDAWNGEQLKGGILDRSLGFSVNEQIRIDNAVVDAGEVRSFTSMSGVSEVEMIERTYEPTAIL